MWRALLRDEAMHARFAWVFLEWARTELDAEDWLEVESAVRTRVTETIAEWRSAAALAPASFSWVSPLGAGDAATYRRRAEAALLTFVVAPFARVGIHAGPENRQAASP